ncbi:MAG: hypothetical protein DRH26_01765 [Deltaproteobacteria bacterium]|nr:MAG: hypothetical protein DRH26_01765 [Deltaproteobacteria bacterium]
MEKVVLLMDRPRKLKFTMNSVCDIEADLGKDGNGKQISLLSVLPKSEREGAAFPFSLLRLLLWGALSDDDESLTPKSAGELLQDFCDSGGNVTDVMVKIMDAFRASGIISSLVKEGEKNGKKKKQR